MTTVRQIEKQWNAQGYQHLLREMLNGRPEASLRLENQLNGPIPTAAMALLRLDELAQAHVPLYSRLLKVILSAQEPDGGWTDPLTTALCLRALMAGRGQGIAIDRGLAYLGQMQKTKGIWPRVPIRRMEADAFVSAFILLELGGDARFASAVQMKDAVEWFQANQQALDGESRRLWDCASRRFPVRLASARRSMQGELSWT